MELSRRRDRRLTTKQRDRSPHGAACHAMYADAKWHKASREYRKQHPLCVICMRADRVRPAEVVDHVIPHRGDYERFWDERNWMALCCRCHNSKTRGEGPRGGLVLRQAGDD